MKSEKFFFNSNIGFMLTESAVLSARFILCGVLGNSVKRRSVKFFCLCAATAALFALALFFAGEAQALRMTMKRVIFEGPKRTEILTIVNNSAEQQTYRMGWREMRMTENKSLVYIKEGEKVEGFQPASPMVVYAPRRVVLAPGASQQIRLMLRRPKDLPEGEYRSHFWIQPEAPANRFAADGAQKGGKGSSVQLKMLTGMTIPVFVRNGNMKASASIGDAHMETGKDGAYKVSFAINREGNRSLYGSLSFTCGPTGPELKGISGLAVYTEVAKRVQSYAVPAPKDGSTCSQIGIKYTAPVEDSYFKGGVMAEGITK